MTRLQDLYTIGGQSPWLDNLRRDWIHGGQLAKWLEVGVRGITSNPTILAKAISGQDTYDDQFRALMKDHTVEAAYWEMAITDINDALAMLAPLYDESDHEDGFVSLEVSPAQAHDTAATVKSARDLHERIAQPNLLVKIPATKEGVPAIKTMISEGHSINVTLIFGLDRYDEVMEAYLRGPRGARGGRARRPAPPRGQRGVVLREPGRHRGGPAPGDPGRWRGWRPRHPRPAGHRRGGPGPKRLSALPPHLRRDRWEALREQAPGSSARSGRRPRRRTRATRTCSTSTA